MTRKPLLLLLNNAPLVLFALVVAVFGSMSGKFLEPQNLVNILVQSSGTGIVAIGMTFVLLTAGVDLSVGSVMFVADVSRDVRFSAKDISTMRSWLGVPVLTGGQVTGILALEKSEDGFYGAAHVPVACPLPTGWR
ncbi:MAG: hypothetical protein HC814_05690, partial [Rhodobacteraceae bacterium]|nr:hypothetical protein [Paracoccaceae bacterium]